VDSNGNHLMRLYAGAATDGPERSVANLNWFAVADA